MKILTSTTTKAKSSGKWLILALGNPSERFADTYHNVGLLAVPTLIEMLTEEEPEMLDWKSHKKLLTYAVTNNFIFAHPLTFMNESGIAAAEAMKKFEVTPERLIVVHDDSDIPLGDFKISFDRSSGGHKGAQSVIDHLKTQTFWRMRIGIRPTHETARKKAGDFVLATIKPSAQKKLEIVFKTAGKELSKRIHCPLIEIR